MILVQEKVRLEGPEGWKVRAGGSDERVGYNGQKMIRKILTKKEMKRVKNY